MATKRKLFISIYTLILVLIVFLSAYSLIGKFIYNSGMTRLKAVDFEVFGKVQGVFFRKYTHEKAKSLNLVGWCQNTDYNTVVGRLEGPEEVVEAMKHWLSKKGSPKSHIDKTEFKNENQIQNLTFAAFEIRR